MEQKHDEFDAFRDEDDLTAEPENLPSGWWIVPAVVFGLIVWGATVQWGIF